MARIITKEETKRKILRALYEEGWVYSEVMTFEEFIASMSKETESISVRLNKGVK